MAISTILVIEDDRFIGEMYVRSLKMAGYNVEWAVDGHDGLVMATNQHYDLILLDIMLPEMRGTEIMTAIRKFEESSAEKSRIVVMTNFDQDEKSRAALENDADAYLIKAEITPRRLIEIIQQLGS